VCYNDDLPKDYLKKSKKAKQLGKRSYKVTTKTWKLETFESIKAKNCLWTYLAAFSHSPGARVDQQVFSIGFASQA
tara:strand:+ start:140 stop:367 length:228 start_codon:yes stop_codon:yes gene_type:complete